MSKPKYSLFLLLLIPLQLLSLPDKGQSFTRVLQVDESGWVQFDHDSHLWRYAGVNLQAFDGSDKLLSSVFFQGSSRHQRKANAPVPTLYDMSVEDERVTLLLRISETSRRHHRLFVTFTRPSFYPWVTLEGSEDGEEWKTLAEGKLFSLEGNSNLQKVALDYPASRMRRLRLTIPHEKGEKLPGIGSVELAYISRVFQPTPWVEEEVKLLRVDEDLKSLFGEDDVFVKRLDLPPWHHAARYLELNIPEEHPPARVTLWHQKEGRAARFYSCTLHTDQSTLPVPSGKLPSPLILVWDRSLGDMEEIFLKRIPKTHYVYVEQPGPLYLTYGGVEAQRRKESDLRPPSEAQVVELPPAVERPLRLSDDLIPLMSKSVIASDEGGESWSLTFPGDAVPWQWVELPVTEEIYNVCRGNLSTLHLTNGKREIPVYHLSSSAPHLVLRNTVDLNPPKEENPYSVEGRFSWEGGHLPLTILKLRASKGPVNHLVRLDYPLPDPGRTVPPTSPEMRWRHVASSSFYCEPWRSPCILLFPLRALPVNELRITFSGSEFPPPSSIRVQLWRRGDRLVFPLPPGADEYQLSTGEKYRRRTFGLDRYVVKDYFPPALAQVVPGEMAERESIEKWGSFLFIGALIFATFMLFLLIFRLLRTGEKPIE